MEQDEFRAASGHQRKPCIFSREVLSKLNEEQLEKVADALLDDGVSNPGIAKVVKRWTGIDVSEQSVLRHRNQSCGCYR